MARTTEMIERQVVTCDECGTEGGIMTCVICHRDICYECGLIVMWRGQQLGVLCKCCIYTGVDPLTNIPPYLKTKLKEMCLAFPKWLI